MATSICNSLMVVKYAVCKRTQKEFIDYSNKSGILLRHIKEIYPDIEIPSNWKRNQMKKQGIIWLDQFFDYIEKEEPKKLTHSCKVCGWETNDIDNRSGYLKTHLKNEHGLTHSQYIEKFPDEESYFKKDFRKKTFESNNENWVECKECGKKFSRLANHLKKAHNLTKVDYMIKYGLSSSEMISKKYMGDCVKYANKGNLVIGEMETKSKFTTQWEEEIKDFFYEMGVELKKGDRSILNGREIDLLSLTDNIGIELNGCKWHTEWFGKKDRHYHLNKTLEAKSKGVKLIQIFEDEYMSNKNVVLSKLKHLFNKDTSPVIGARKLTIKEITRNEALEFLEKFHIQGKVKQTKSYGAFNKDNELLSVMSFKLNDPETRIWELVRFATNINFKVPGVGGRLLKYFINENDFSEIISFADRRWTLDESENLYTKLGFKLVDILKPDYKYFSSKLDRYKRFHKFRFRKNKMSKQYNLPITLTESEMAKEIGLDRIWDCGLLKYSLNKKR